MAENGEEMSVVVCSLLSTTSKGGLSSWEMSARRGQGVQVGSDND